MKIIPSNKIATIISYFTTFRPIHDNARQNSDNAQHKHSANKARREKQPHK